MPNIQNLITDNLKSQLINKKTTQQNLGACPRIDDVLRAFAVGLLFSDKLLATALVEKTLEASL